MNFKEIDRTSLEEYNSSRAEELRGSFCHAPAVNLNFDQFGNMRTCCYNLQDVVGKYPEVSIQEAWGSANLKNIRKQFENQCAMGDCKRCVEQIEGRNTTSMLARGFDEIRQKQIAMGEADIDYPQMLEFELSNTCNLMCVMCNGKFSSMIRAKREGLPPIIGPYDEAFFEQLKPFLRNARRIKFLGGEPFLIEIYIKIWNYLIEINSQAELSITTNGTVFNSTVSNVLSKLNSSIVISIDSIDEKTYESIRVGASFKKTMDNIERYKDILAKLNRRLNFSICPMTNNWQEIPRMIAHLDKFAEHIGFNQVYYPESLSLLSLDPEKRKEIANFWISESRRLSFENLQIQNRMLLSSPFHFLAVTADA